MHACVLEYGRTTRTVSVLAGDEGRAFGLLLKDNNDRAFACSSTHHHSKAPFPLLVLGGRVGVWRHSRGTRDPFALIQGSLMRWWLLQATTDSQRDVLASPQLPLVHSIPAFHTPSTPSSPRPGCPPPFGLPPIPPPQRGVPTAKAFRCPSQSCQPPHPTPRSLRQPQSDTLHACRHHFQQQQHHELLRRPGRLPVRVPRHHQAGLPTSSPFHPPRQGQESCPGAASTTQCGQPGQSRAHHQVRKNFTWKLRSFSSGLVLSSVHLSPPFSLPFLLSSPSSASFLDVQAAWDTLKTPQTRQAYDEQLRRQEREEQGGGFIAEEVKVDEMEDEEGREDGEEGWLVSPCRCGEGFRVRKEEVEGMREEEGGKERRGVIVACDGCSLRIFVHR